MKSWTVRELSNVVGSLEPLLGLRLQEVQTSAQDVVLGFYSSEGVLWLWLDLNAISPCILPWTQLPLKPAVAKTPLQLFLRAHFVGKTLSKIESSAEFGRVVTFHFGASAHLEVRLFPHGRNLLAFSDKKKIAWQKPKELDFQPEFVTRESPARDLETLREQWLQMRSQGKGVQKNKQGAKSSVQNNIDKKLKAIQKVDEELKRKLDLPWRAIGDWMKENQSLEVKKDWEPFVDKRRKLSWNIDQCYTKAREAEGKIQGTEKRLESLRRELEQLEKNQANPKSQPIQPVAKAKPSLGDIEAQGRTLRLKDDMTVVAGKSAADNVKILRKARAWDLWFHLRDFPSSHAVLFRNKGARVNDNVLNEIGAWFLRTHFGAKAKNYSGEKFSIVVCECRFVRTIKGDKLGRVNYHDERVFICSMP